MANEKCTINKEVLTEFCKNNLHIHTDWTGTYVETQYRCNDVEKFVDNLWTFLTIEEENESENLHKKLMPILVDFAKKHLNEKVTFHYPFCTVIIEL